MICFTGLGWALLGSTFASTSCSPETHAQWSAAVHLQHAALVVLLLLWATAQRPAAILCLRCCSECPVPTTLEEHKMIQDAAKSEWKLISGFWIQFKHDQPYKFRKRLHGCSHKFAMWGIQKLGIEPLLSVATTTVGVPTKAVQMVLALARESVALHAPTKSKTNRPSTGSLQSKTGKTRYVNTLTNLGMSKLSNWIEFH